MTTSNSSDTIFEDFSENEGFAFELNRNDFFAINFMFLMAMGGVFAASGLIYVALGSELIAGAFWITMATILVFASYSFRMIVRQNHETQRNQREIMRLFKGDD